MNVFEKICSDQEIIDRYNEVEKNEEKAGGWAYHNFKHVYNVCEIVEKILKDLNYDYEFIENAKIAAILHDTGANEGKENHAYRSYIFAKNYLIKNNIKLKFEEDVLDAIKIHSDGFETNNAIALSIILSDKLDIKGNRITKKGKEIVGNRQYQYIKDIKIKIEEKRLNIQFIVDNEFDKKEADEFYFTKKVFRAIDSFCKKFDLIPSVFINDERWDVSEI